jgi:hypothetical protein
MTWREQYRPIIAKVIAAHGGVESKELRQALRDAFPSGPREYHPYRIWLDEIRKQLSQPTETPLDVKRPIEPLPGQRELF